MIMRPNMVSDIVAMSQVRSTPRSRPSTRSSRTRSVCGPGTDHRPMRPKDWPRSRPGRLHRQLEASAIALDPPLLGRGLAAAAGFADQRTQRGGVDDLLRIDAQHPVARLSPACSAGPGRAPAADDRLGIGRTDADAPGQRGIGLAGLQRGQRQQALGDHRRRRGQLQAQIVAIERGAGRLPAQVDQRIHLPATRRCLRRTSAGPSRRPAVRPARPRCRRAACPAPRRGSWCRSTTRPHTAAPPAPDWPAVRPRRWRRAGRDLRLKARSRLMRPTGLPARRACAHSRPAAASSAPLGLADATRPDRLAEADREAQDLHAARTRHPVVAPFMDDDQHAERDERQSGCSCGLRRPRATRSHGSGPAHPAPTTFERTAAPAGNRQRLQRAGIDRDAVRSG